MDTHGGYRDAAPPAPERFAVRMAPAARLWLLLALASVALSIAVLLVTGRLFVLFLFALGPGLFYLLSGAPRRVDVHHDRVEIHSWLRRPVRLSYADTSVELAPDELIFASADVVVSIAIDHFPGDSLERCVRALEARGVHVRG